MLFPFLLALNMFVYAFSFISDSEIHSQKIFILTVYILSIGLPFYSLIRSDKGIQNFFIDDEFFYSLSDIFPFSSLLIAMFRLFSSSISSSSFDIPLLFSKVSFKFFFFHLFLIVKYTHKKFLF